jgi:hypothetical protein
MARQHPWHTPGQPASADDTWPLEDPYGEPGPGPAGQQDQQPAVPGPGSQGGGFVPAASYRLRRSPARPAAPRKARPARNTPLLPGRVLIAAALAGIAAGAGIAAIAGQPAIRLVPADNPAATSQYTPTAGPAAPPSPAASSAPPAPGPSPSAGAAEPPAISTAAARRVLVSYWAANNRANKARSDTMLARIEAGTSYQMDAGAYRTGRAAGPGGSRYTPVTAENPVLWIPRQPAGTYPRWFAARVTYMGEGAGYLVFTQPRAGAPWKNVLEPYLLHGTGPGPFVTAGTDGYAAQADPDADGLAVTPAQIEAQTAASFDGAATAVGNPGNLADMRDETYFAAHLPPGSAAGDRHLPSGMVFAVQTTGGGALAFYSLTAAVSLTPPPGQALEIGIPGYYTPARPQTSTVTIRYVEQFAAYLPPGHARAQLLADASGIAG